MTNREWLESLSDKELAEKINRTLLNCREMCMGCCPFYCIRSIMDWLQSEHKDDIKKEN